MFFVLKCNFCFLYFDQCVSCYARFFILDKFFVRDMEEVPEMATYLKTKDDFNSKSTIYNDVDLTYFDCPNQKGSVKAYGFQPGKIDTGTFSQNDEDIWVDLDVIPVLPLYKFCNLTC